jgi:hypothetical protein
MRLLVETPGDTSTGAANNLVKNSDGATGVWWWTRSSGTLMQAGSPGLTFKAGAAVVVQAQTGYMPVTSETWVSCRFDLTAIQATHNVQAIYEFSDATRTVLSTTGASGAITATGTHYLSGAQAPASTSYVRVLFYYYSGATGTAVCATGDSVTVTDVMVTTSTTNTFTTTRHNLMPNPSFEADTSGWTAGAGTAVIGRFAYVGGESLTGAGSYLLRVTPNLGPVAYANGPLVGVQANARYALSAYMNGMAGSPQAGGANVTSLGFLYRFFNSAGVQIGTDQTVSAGPSPTGSHAFSRISTVVQAPPGANSLRMYPYATYGATDQQGSFNVDAVMVEQASAVGDYFDGSTRTSITGDIWIYRWDGANGTSTSTATLSGDGYDYVNPTEAWTDILGSANQIGTKRATLDTSTLTATIVDPALDPSTDPNDLLKKGRKIQLQATSDGGTSYEPVYTGTISDAAVTYVLDNENPTLVRPKITVSATDAASDLASLLSPNCYDTIAALPQAIDVPGNTHPWTCNGDTGIGVSTAPVSVDTQSKMSVLDQIATTRDTVSGLAFIDRAGVVNAWDGDTYVSPVSDNYSDEASAVASYSDLQVGYDELSIVNAVRVVVNSLDASGTTTSTYWPGGGTTDPGTAGPISTYYVDQDSIDQHGLATATYTINMAAPTSASVEAYAQAVLSANSTPRRIVTSMTVPVLDADGIARATLTDLCSVIGVAHSDLTSADHRVQSIQHSIQAGNGVPDKWLVSYGFAAPEAVAAPQVTPPAAGTVVAEGTTFTSGVVNAHGPFPVTTSITPTSGTAFTISKAGVYRFSASCMAWCPSGNTAVQRGIYWYVDGVLRAAQSFYFNQASVHTTMPTQFWIQSLTAGTHYVTCSNGGDLNMDTNDLMCVSWGPA